MVDMTGPTRPIVVVTQHAILDPDNNWPLINAALFEVLVKLHGDHVRLLMRSPQEIKILDALRSHYLVRIQLVGLKGIIDTWQAAWIEDWFDAVSQSSVRIEWYPRSGRRQPVDAWSMQDAVGLVLIRSSHEQQVYQSLVEHAWQHDIPVVRIDPETHQVVRVKQPINEGEPS